MFRYYQTTEKGRWLPIRDSADVESRVKAAKGIKMTVLALSEIIDEDDTGPKTYLKYKGPWYADIDDKGNIESAALSTLELVEKLKGLGTPESEIMIFASGTKGFHVLVPMTCFTNGRAMVNLPLIYKHVALALYVKGLDFAPYAGGRGNTFRLTNVKREGKDVYRVPVTIEELKGCTAERYQLLVSSPRPLPDPATGIRVQGLETLFEQAKRASNQRINYSSVAEDRLKSAFPDNEIPNCVAALRDGKVRQGAKFNSVAMALGQFITRSGLGELSTSSLVALAAEKNTSTQYDTPRKRAGHIYGQADFARNHASYQFSCNFMRSLCQVNVCVGCLLNQQDEDAMDLMETLRLVERNGAYFKEGSEEPISSFLIEVSQRYKEEVHGSTVTTGQECKVSVAGGGVYTRVVPESAWSSKSALLAALHGIDGLSFFGSDSDVQRIRYSVFSKTEDGGAEEVAQVTGTGIHLTEHRGHEIRIYIEPGYSIDSNGVCDTHILSDAVQYSASVQDLTIPSATPEFDELLSCFFSLVSPAKMGYLLGWYTAAHLKPHFLKATGRGFPLLNVWGQAGAGKSETVRLLQCITGLDEEGIEYFPNLPSSTYYPIMNLLSTTTTTPRVLEEFNRSKFIFGMRTKYTQFLELLKTAWGSESAPRGTLGTSNDVGKVGRRQSNVVILDNRVIAPVVYINEQGPPQDVPAMIERTLQVMISKSTQNPAAFNYVRERAMELRKLASLLIRSALHTPSDKIKARFEETEMELRIPVRTDLRPKKSLHITWTGLSHLRATVGTLCLPKAHAQLDHVMRATRAVMESGEDVITSSTRTEVDNYLDTVCEMAYFAAEDVSRPYEFIPGKHYAVVGMKLYLDLVTTHIMARSFVRSTGGHLVLENPAQFLMLARSEPYFLGIEVRPDLVGHQRQLLVLDMTEMESKGLAVSLVPT